MMYDEFGNPVEGEEDNAVGGLSRYSDPLVRDAMAKIDEVAKQQQARYDAQAKALAEKRYGPSFSERMFQLAGALAEPTKTGFSGVLSNVAPVLAGQMQAKRAGELSRREALEQLNKDQLEQQMGLAKQGLTTATAMARINNKPPVRGVAVGDTLRDPYTNAPIGPEFNRVPMPDYYKALEAAPTPENLQAAVAYYPTFAVQLKAAYDRGLKNKGR
jgi:hypothetical protein